MDSLDAKIYSPGCLLLPFRHRQRTFYFETSAWDALQRRGGLLSDWGRLLARATSRRFSIVAGVIVFEETLPIYKDDPALGDARLEIIGSLADLRRTIAHAPDLLQQHLVATLCGKAPPPPFTDQYVDLVSARHCLMENRPRIAELMEPNAEKDLNSEKTMRAGREAIRAELAKSGWPKISFRQFRDLEAASFQNYIDHYFGPGAPLPSQTLSALSSSRPLRMYRDGLLAMMHQQTVRGRAPSHSDLRDLHHAVAASLTDGLVTNDEDFRDWCQLVALPDFDVYLLTEFLEVVRT